MSDEREPSEPSGGDHSHFDPDTYSEWVLSEVPGYRALQDAAVEATREMTVHRLLDLGIGTGETSVRVLAIHPEARVTGVDENPRMLAVAHTRLPSADLRVGRLEEPLPEGEFDLVVSALAIHHLDAAGKQDLFARVARHLASGGRFVIADLVIPRDPADVNTFVDGVYDMPSGVDQQLEWLENAGLHAHQSWGQADLAVLVGEAPDRSSSPPRSESPV